MQTKMTKEKQMIEDIQKCASDYLYVFNDPNKEKMFDDEMLSSYKRLLDNSIIAYAHHLFSKPN